MTSTLDFQGQIFKMLFLRNGTTDWHGTKGMWVERMLDSHCDFELWPHPWPWPWIFKVSFKIAVSQEGEGQSTWNERDVNRSDVTPTVWPWTMTLTLYFEGQILKKLYHRNKRVDWHGTKWMWVERMLDPSFDCKLLPHPWPWPWIFKVKFLIAIL